MAMPHTTHRSWRVHDTHELGGRLGPAFNALHRRAPQTNDLKSKKAINKAKLS
jgi:hypothetical protein